MVLVKTSGGGCRADSPEGDLALLPGLRGAHLGTSDAGVGPGPQHSRLLPTAPSLGMCWCPPLPASPPPLLALLPPPVYF